MLAGWGAPIKYPIFGGYVFFRLTLVALQLSGYSVNQAEQLQNLYHDNSC